MLIQVNHRTNYLYSEPVGLGVHKLFLVPQHRPYFRIEHQKVHIQPGPIDSNFRQDLAGNWYQQAWFTGQTQEFKIQTEWIFRLDSFNPFGFILDKNFEDSAWDQEFPRFSYLEINDFLLPFLNRTSSKDYGDFIQPMKRSSSGLVDLLVNLTQKIHQDWKHIIRHEPNVWNPEKTYDRKEGSCRDLALMQIDMLRAMGIASRFVSGYAFNPELKDGHELHAWVEVYLPGSGWVGMDPSLGLLADHRFIPLAVHPDPLLTMPVQGAFLGTAQSTLKTRVDIKVIRP